MVRDAKGGLRVPSHPPNSKPDILPHPATPAQLCSVKARETKRGLQCLLGLWDVTWESQGRDGPTTLPVRQRPFVPMWLFEGDNSTLKAAVGPDGSICSCSWFQGSGTSR